MAQKRRLQRPLLGDRLDDLGVLAFGERRRPDEVDYDPWEGMDVEAWRREERERRKES